MNKWIGILATLCLTSWSGWYKDQVEMEKALSAGRLDKGVARYCGVIIGQGNTGIDVYGSGVVVKGNLIITAQHGLKYMDFNSHLPYFSLVPDVSEACYSLKDIIGGKPLKFEEDISVEAVTRKIKGVVASDETLDLAILELTDTFPEDRVAPILGVSGFETLAHNLSKQTTQHTLFCGYGGSLLSDEWWVKGMSVKDLRDIHTDIRDLTAQHRKHPHCRSVSHFNLREYVFPAVCDGNERFFSHMDFGQSVSSVSAKDSGGGLFVNGCLAAIATRGGVARDDQAPHGVFLKSNFVSLRASSHLGEESFFNRVMKDYISLN